MRILMVEDDRKLCEAVCYQLEREGFTVDVCSDGDDGLRWIRQQAHDLVILDRNPLTTPASELKDIRVLETIKEGRTVFVRS